ncbi:hypothetical protein COT82_02055 [Candidatus Campbellbacteria bacterium CG10_big_fil_rev_8_21_14_0_10_35_52]|uniref:Helix-turn-helix domain-containing protein n=1 Tax=Candidatus Campbellbacteria bacterium CG10_big_fil_rev_8_21_14_0_10_35_52 TaxID=1974527 RepID=A0A2M6WV13_9BACT|nr:MAG: hypothetical protein COT82_02055 [Candidatus Campbellbacteria bacterium CG10_big_fil_rev_8_21_14_0_10_35_52]
MEELIFAGNKYISSKRAAKLTGYSVDYIGQMCRSGNMDCRLIGRNWYVKETAVVEQRKSFKKEQNARMYNRIAYKKYELENPMYYIDDNRPNNLEINKKVLMENQIDEEKNNIENEVKSIGEYITHIPTIEKSTVDLRKYRQDYLLQNQNNKAIIKRQGIALQTRRNFYPAGIITVTLAIVGILFIAGSFILERNVTYSVNNEKMNTKIHLASGLKVFNLSNLINIFKLK